MFRFFLSFIIFFLVATFSVALTIELVQDEPQPALLNDDPQTGSPNVTEKWSYRPKTALGITGQDDWSLVYPSCNATSQSPVNINTTTSTLDDKLPQPEIKAPNGTIIYGKLMNEGHVLVFEVNHARKADLYMNLSSDRYILDSISFHFGCDNFKGAEHTIDGFHFPGEYQLTFRNLLYGNLTDALKQKDGVIIMAVFMQLNNAACVNFMVQQLLDQVVVLTSEGDYLHYGVDIFVLVPVLRRKLFYYTYIGSLTAPPCSQEVRWIVVQDAVRVTSCQLRLLRSLKSRHGGDIWKMCNNFRETQPLNGRNITGNRQI